MLTESIVFGPNLFTHSLLSDSITFNRVVAIESCEIVDFSIRNLVISPEKNVVLNDEAKIIDSIEIQYKFGQPDLLNLSALSFNGTITPNNYEIIPLINVSQNGLYSEIDESELTAQQFVILMGDFGDKGEKWASNVNSQNYKGTFIADYYENGLDAILAVPDIDDEDDNTDDNSESDNNTDDNSENDDSTDDNPKNDDLEDDNPVEDDEDDLSPGEIAGIVIASVVVVTIIAVLTFFFVKKKREQSGATTNTDTDA